MENLLLIRILKPLVVELILYVELTLYVELIKTPICPLSRPPGALSTNKELRVDYFGT